MTEWLLCDYGKVLSEPPPPQEWAELARTAGRTDPAGDFDERYWRHRPAYDRGDIPAGEYWSRVVGGAPAPALLARLVELDTAVWLHPDSASVAAAVRAGGRGFHLAILSNAPVEVAAGIDGLAELAPFERRFYSSALRAVKPEPEVYARVLATLRAEPGDVVLVDDRPANVDAAAAAGMHALLYRGPDQFDALLPAG